MIILVFLYVGSIKVAVSKNLLPVTLSEDSLYKVMEKELVMEWFRRELASGARAGIGEDL